MSSHNTWNFSTAWSLPKLLVSTAFRAPDLTTVPSYWEITFGPSVAGPCWAAFSEAADMLSPSPQRFQPLIWTFYEDSHEIGITDPHLLPKLPGLSDNCPWTTTLSLMLSLGLTFLPQTQFCALWAPQSTCSLRDAHQNAPAPLPTSASLMVIGTREQEPFHHDPTPPCIQKTSAPVQCIF